MVLSLKKVFGVLLIAALHGACHGERYLRLSYESDAGIVHEHLGTRDDTLDCVIGDPEAPLCEAICAPSSSSCSTTPIDKRSPRERHNILTSSNESTLYDVYDGKESTHTLGKRAFSTLTQGALVKYVATQFQGRTRADKYFGPPSALVDGGNDNTVVLQPALGDQPFAIGAQRLHGCTMITVVSSQAVHMGHYWEGPAWIGNTKGPDWGERVLNYFRGGDIFGKGPQLDTALFPKDDPNTRLYIMTPRRAKENDPYKEVYKVKLAMLIQTIKDALNYQDVPIVVYKYHRLNDDPARDPVEYQIYENAQAGVALFQYDPNGHGTGQRGWRLFYDQHMFSDTDPAPNSPNGIPDL